MVHFVIVREAPARYSIGNVSIVDLTALRDVAGRAGDMMQVGLCVLAIEGKIDFDEWPAFSPSEKKLLEAISQIDALRMCVSVLNAAEDQRTLAHSGDR
jgi:hypothetical protein